MGSPCRFSSHSVCTVSMATLDHRPPSAPYPMSKATCWRPSRSGKMVDVYSLEGHQDVWTFPRSLRSSSEAFVAVNAAFAPNIAYLSASADAWDEFIEITLGVFYPRASPVSVRTVVDRSSLALVSLFVTCPHGTDRDTLISIVPTRGAVFFMDLTMTAFPLHSSEGLRSHGWRFSHVKWCLNPSSLHVFNLRSAANDRST